MKYKEMLKKCCKDFDKASTSGKSLQAGVVKEAYENPCDVMTTQSGKEKYSDAWLFDSRCTYYMCPKSEWFSTYKPFDGGSILMGNKHCVQDSWHWVHLYEDV